MDEAAGVFERMAVAGPIRQAGHVGSAGGRHARRRD